MNKPASKEPSMDEILSSIRQIIADDEPADEPQPPQEDLIEEITADEAAAVDDLTADLNEVADAHEEMIAEPVGFSVDDDEDAPLTLGVEQMLDAPPAKPQTVIDEADDEAPLALGVEQMLDAVDPASVPDETTKAAPAPEEFGAEFGDDISDDVAQVVPGDVAFVGDDEEDVSDISAMLESSDEPSMDVAEIDLDDATNDIDLASLEDMPEEREDEPEMASAPSALPDPHLSDDIADQLLEPTTQAAASSAFSRLDALTLSSNGQTVEDLIRELLRPMLKGWLDENLPGVVEKLVQREIERVSRGKR